MMIAPLAAAAFVATLPGRPPSGVGLSLGDASSCRPICTMSKGSVGTPRLSVVLGDESFSPSEGGTIDSTRGDGPSRPTGSGRGGNRDDDSRRSDDAVAADLVTVDVADTAAAESILVSVGGRGRRWLKRWWPCGSGISGAGSRGESGHLGGSLLCKRLW